MLKPLILALALLFICNVSAHENHDQKNATKAEAKSTLIVKQMTWGGCAGKVKRALSKIKGISLVTTKVASRQVIIEHSADFDIDSAIKAIKDKAKFVAVVKTDEVKEK